MDKVVSSAYYNEIDPFAAGWLRELIKASLIAPGEVDERSIEEVKPDDLRGFRQCHFFAGIGVWSYALRNAGWSDDSPVWTGSCPCQGFSASGQRGGFSDKRHLWPAWFRLIGECRPVTVFGEQVASKDGLAWLDVVSADMEAEGYAIGAADICAAGFGAPHIRQRLYFVAESQSHGRWQHYQAVSGSETKGIRNTKGQNERGAIGEAGRPIHSGAVSIMADSERQQLRAGRSRSAEPKARALQADNGQRERLRNDVGERSAVGGMVNAERGRRNGRQDLAQPEECGNGHVTESTGKEFTNGFWRDAEWIYCRDGKHRSVEPGTFPLVAGTSNRVGRLRGYGNAINAEVAKGFIEAYMNTVSTCKG